MLDISSSRKAAHPVNAKVEQGGGVATAALLIALSVDAVLIRLHLAVPFNEQHLSMHSLGADGSYPEMFSYALAAAGAAMFLLKAWRAREAAYAVCGAFLAYVALDDALRLHEQAGRWIGARAPVETIAGLRVSDSAGEIVFLSIVGALFAAAAWSPFRRAVGDVRTAIAMFLAIMLFYILCGGAIDAAHAITDDARLTVFEDGGELVAVTLLSALALFVLIRSDSPRRAP